MLFQFFFIQFFPFFFFFFSYLSRSSFENIIILQSFTTSHIICNDVTRTFFCHAQLSLHAWTHTPEALMKFGDSLFLTFSQDSAKLYTNSPFIVFNNVCVGGHLKLSRMVSTIRFLFQRSSNRTCCSKRDNFITEDTIETASHFIRKDCL